MARRVHYCTTCRLTEHQCDRALNCQIMTSKKYKSIQSKRRTIMVAGRVILLCSSEKNELKILLQKKYRHHNRCECPAIILSIIFRKEMQILLFYHQLAQRIYKNAKRMQIFMAIGVSGFKKNYNYYHTLNIRFTENLVLILPCLNNLI